MQTPLFLEDQVEFEKSAAQTQLPEDPNAWPNEVLQELYKQAPYIADFSPHVVMEKVDGEQGYGLGHIEVANQTEIQTAASPESRAAAGVRQVRVPVVIKDGMLQPFDLLVSDDSKVLPLTETRLRAAIFRPQAFDVTSRTPGDISMVGQLYPPYRQNMGFGGGGTTMNVGMGKEGSALEAFLSEGKTKTAGDFTEFSDILLDENYLHGVEGAKVDRAGFGRLGKQAQSGDHEAGALDAFIAKHAGCATQAMKNLAEAKTKATAAMVRTRQVAAKTLKKTGSVLAAIVDTINEADRADFMRAISNPELAPALYKNAAAITPAIQLVMEAPARRKLASALPSMLHPSVVQVKRLDDGYRVKAASHLFYEPLVSTIDRGEALRRFGEKVVLAADLSGAVTLADGADAFEPPEEQLDADLEGALPVTRPGMYRVRTPEGEVLTGYVIPNLVDIDGTTLPLALFTNGERATVQTDVVGVPDDTAPLDLPTADVPRGRGVFATDAGPSGALATVPLDISATLAGVGSGEPMSYKATSFSGEEVLVSVQPNVQAPASTGNGKLLIPQSWVWVPLDKAEPVVVESQEGAPKMAAVARELASVHVVSGGGGTFSVRGSHVEKLAHDEREMLGIDDAMFLLASLGVEQGYGASKLAEAHMGLAPVRVRVGREIKLASDERESAAEEAAALLSAYPDFKQNLFKEAATLGDPTAVDTVLALGFLNPENLMTFVGYLPVIEDAQSKMCDILLASRLGNLIDTPEGAIERAVRCTEAVLEGLKALAFQNN